MFQFVHRQWVAVPPPRRKKLQNLHQMSPLQQETSRTLLALRWFDFQTSPYWKDAGRNRLERRKRRLQSCPRGCTIEQDHVALTGPLYPFLVGPCACWNAQPPYMATTACYKKATFDPFLLFPLSFFLFITRLTPDCFQKDFLVKDGRRPRGQHGFLLRWFFFLQTCFHRGELFGTWLVKFVPRVLW